MSSSIAKYFSSKVSSSNKRKPSSSSPDSSPPDRHSDRGGAQGLKKQRTVSECSVPDSNTEMEEIKTNIDCMKEKLNFICGMREDVQNLCEEISKISETLSRKVDILESAIFSLQQDKDKLSEEVQQVKKENTSLRSQMEAGRKENRDLRAVQNDNEQHGRLWNVRVHGIREGTRPAEEAMSLEMNRRK
ncbi:hypothetical protein ACOMHN_002900 [Nucella lapillus]